MMGEKTAAAKARSEDSTEPPAAEAATSPAPALDLLSEQKT
jgi:hypothetical protein